MHDVTVIEDPAAAEVSLDPIRSRLLAELATPASASMLAGKIGLPRQKVNYHLRTLEQHGLVELVEERRKGNVTERMLQATAASYVISPTAMAAVAPDPSRAPDRLSARWLLAVAARLVRDVGSLITGAATAEERAATAEDRAATAEEPAATAEEPAATAEEPAATVEEAATAGRLAATYALDGEITFASAADRAAFAEDLTAAVTQLVSRYNARGGDKHRIVVAVHPAVPESENPRMSRGQGVPKPAPTPPREVDQPIVIGPPKARASTPPPEIESV